MKKVRKNISLGLMQFVALDLLSESHGMDRSAYINSLINTAYGQAVHNGTVTREQFDERLLAINERIYDSRQ